MIPALRLLGAVAVVLVAGCNGSVRQERIDFVNAACEKHKGLDHFFANINTTDIVCKDGTQFDNAIQGTTP